ncbi:MAG: sulfur carrier protein ThiS [Amphritea sp.]|nr:sulfur carrier protein ThiS [Amphritea sp.]
MRLTVNGENIQLFSANNLEQLLETLNLKEKRIAVEVNREIIPRSEHGVTRLREGDRVEIVRAVGGG